MRAVLQRVVEASVEVDGKIVGRIGTGLLVLLGVAESDQDRDAVYIADKIADLRLFDDDEGRINRALTDLEGASALVISQFTLLGDCRKGRRPSWSQAARPDEARRLYEAVIARLRARDVPTETGVFQAAMQVRLTNDGPVTVLLDSEKVF